MIDDIKRIEEEAFAKIEKVEDSKALDQLRVEYLGKKGRVTSFLQQLKNIEADKRKEIGAVLNKLKSSLESEIETRRKSLNRLQIEKELEKSQPLDVTLPGWYPQSSGNIHPISRVMNEIVEIMRRIGFSVYSGPEVELEYYNFEALNTPEHHPARDLQDTFYIKPPVLLRSQTSTVQIRCMEKNPPPLQIISCGRVYRSDYDRTHSPMFHQMEGLMVDETITFADLKGVIHHLLNNLFGRRQVRFRPSFFPFTEPSAEVDMQFNGEWMEIAGCGMVHPNVFNAVKYDTEKYTGFAFGIGIERVAMIKYGMSDIRAFFENDYRMLEQF